MGQSVNIALKTLIIIPQYLHSRLCSLLENNGVTEEDWDRPEYWKGRLSVGDLSSLSTSEEAISLVYEVNSTPKSFFIQVESQKLS